MVNTLIICYLTVSKLIIDSDAQSVIPIDLPQRAVPLIMRIWHDLIISSMARIYRVQFFIINRSNQNTEVKQMQIKLLTIKKTKECNFRVLKREYMFLCLYMEIF